MSSTMLPDPLVPTSALPLDLPELWRRLDQLDPPLSIDVRASKAGEALVRSLLFEHWPDLIAGEALELERRFYNRYFWFARVVALWQAEHGSDAGLEQQLFQMTEQADFPIDWDLLQELDARAKQELERSQPS
jgi:hypothetical protein